MIAQFSITREQIDILTTFVMQSLERDHELQSILEQTGTSDRSVAIANEEDAEKLAE